MVNQTALNVTASGIAVPQDNGDISLVLYGAFPIKVNRDGQAAVNFELELTLAADADDQPQIVADMTAPFITAQYPSACSYQFGVQSFETEDSLSRLSRKESNCVDFLASNRVAFPRALEDYNEFLGLFGAPSVDNDTFYSLLAMAMKVEPTEPYINSLSLNEKPAITFSEPVDPQALDGQITLQTSDGETLQTRLTARGSSVVVNPVDGFDDGQVYTLNVGSGVTDYAGRNLTGDFAAPITFATSPVVTGNEDIVRQAAPFVLGSSVGLQCALVDGNFRDGGDIAGRCFADLGDEPEDIQEGDTVTSPKRLYDVFEQPVNQSIEAVFSKPSRARNGSTTCSNSL